MPVVVALLAIVLLVLLVVALTPLTLVLRYRAGTARRPSRRWLATLNTLTFAMSSAFFLLAAAVGNIWIPYAFVHALAGFAVGCGLGRLGLALSRWEATPDALHYTPPRWLVLAITLVVTTRMAYGLWRAWHAWRSTPDDASWLAASGAAGSLAAGGVVIGYSLAFWIGVWVRSRRYRQALEPVARPSS